MFAISLHILHHHFFFGSEFSYSDPKKKGQNSGEICFFSVFFTIFAVFWHYSPVFVTSQS
jgi:hypothetical protein